MAGGSTKKWAAAAVLLALLLTATSAPPPVAAAPPPPPPPAAPAAAHHHGGPPAAAGLFPPSWERIFQCMNECMPPCEFGGTKTSACAVACCRKCVGAATAASNKMVQPLDNKEEMEKKCRNKYKKI